MNGYFLNFSPSVSKSTIQGVSEFDTYFFITGTPIKTTPYVKISVRQFGLMKELEQF